MECLEIYDFKVELPSYQCVCDLLHLVSTLSISTVDISEKKKYTFSRDPLKCHIFLQLVLSFGHKYAPSSMINSYTKYRTLFSKGLKVSPIPEMMD